MSFSDPVLMSRPAYAGLLLGCACMASAAWAGTPVDETHPIKAQGRIDVSNVAGSIEVATWSRNEVRITGELGEGTEKLEVSGDPGSMTVEVVTPKNARHLDDTQLSLTVPAGVTLKLASVSADIKVEGVQGDVAANSVSGDLTLDLKSKAVNVRTVSGQIQLHAPATHAMVNTVSGDVEARELSGSLQLETVSGDVHLEGGRFDKGEFKSISGDLELQMSLSKDAQLSGESLSGDIRLLLPADTSAAVSLHSFSGTLHSGFEAGRSASRDRGKKLDFTLAGGNARVDLSSFSGDIDVTPR